MRSLFAALVCLGLASLSPAPVQTLGFGQPHVSAVTKKLPILRDARILDYGRVVYQGEVDLNPSIERIKAGRKLNHRNDGGFFGNRERRLPVVNDREFYREFVYTQAGLKFPGPARIVLSKDGVVYFTGDHYGSFTRVNQ